MAHTATYFSCPTSVEAKITEPLFFQAAQTPRSSLDFFPSFSWRTTAYQKKQLKVGPWKAGSKGAAAIWKSRDFLYHLFSRSLLPFGGGNIWSMLLSYVFLVLGRGLRLRCASFHGDFRHHLNGTYGLYTSSRSRMHSAPSSRQLLLVSDSKFD